MNKFGLIGIAVAVVGSASPALAQADAGNSAAVAALREAEAARAHALDALARADRAIAEANRLLAAQAGQPAPLITERSVTASSVTSPGKPDFTKIVDEAVGSPGTGLSKLTADYFGLRGVKAYRTKLSPAFRISGGSSGGYAELGPSYSRRSFAIDDDGTYRPSVQRWTLTGLAKIDENDKVSLGSWSADKGFTPSSDLAVAFEYRRSWGPETKLAPAKATLVDTLAKMHAACVAAAKDKDDPCNPDNIGAWMAKKDRGVEYALSSVAPFWGLSKDDDIEDSPRHYAGVKGRLGFLKEEFFPLSDPGGTGVPLIPGLPQALGKALPASRKFNPAMVKAYYGFALNRFDKDGLDIGLALSAGWQNAVRYPADTEDVEVCYQDLPPMPPSTDPPSPTQGFVRCREINIAVPYAASGMTFGVGLNLLPPVTWIGRPNVSLLASYDAAFEQWSVGLPIAFAVDDKGDLKAGIKATWTSRGETPFGTKLEAKGDLSVFLEYALDWPAIP